MSLDPASFPERRKRGKVIGGWMQVLVAYNLNIASTLPTAIGSLAKRQITCDAPEAKRALWPPVQLYPTELISPCGDSIRGALAHASSHLCIGSFGESRKRQRTSDFLGRATDIAAERYGKES